MTYRELLESITEELKAANVPDADTDAWRLFESVCNVTRAKFLLLENDKADDAETKRLKEIAKKRAEHVPLQYLTGEQDFYGCRFLVSSDTLIPRFDTEILADLAVKRLKGVGEKASILDVCTGTGCILTAVTKSVKTEVSVGCDISKNAVELAKKNLELNGLEGEAEFFSGDLFEALKDTKYENKKFDLIVSNPPYIRTSEIEKLDREVRDFEPRAALDGGEDGLWFYVRIISEAGKHLENGGVLMFETGFDQGEAVKEIMTKNGFINVTIHKDLAGLDRVVEGELYV